MSSRRIGSARFSKDDCKERMDRAVGAAHQVRQFSEFKVHRELSSGAAQRLRAGRAIVFKQLPLHIKLRYTILSTIL